MPRYSRSLRSLALPFAIAALVSLTACGGSPPEPEATEPAAGPRAENATLSLALAAVPPGFEVAANAGQELRLRRTDGQAGEAWVEIGGEQTAGINLVKAVSDEKARFEGLPEGQFLGQIELGSQLGTAYSVRGRFRDEAGIEQEEQRLLMLHPVIDNRLLRLVYAYPAGEDTKMRAEQLWELLAEVEGVYPQPAGG